MGRNDVAPAAGRASPTTWLSAPTDQAAARAPPDHQRAARSRRCPTPLPKWQLNMSCSSAEAPPTPGPGQASPGDGCLLEGAGAVAGAEVEESVGVAPQVGAGWSELPVAPAGEGLESVVVSAQWRQVAHGTAGPGVRVAGIERDDVVVVA